MKITAAVALSLIIVSISACARKDADSEPAATPAPSETTAQNDAAMAPDTATPAAPDQAFFDKAAEGGMAEVEAGKLAEEKASSSDVKKFGAMMVTDHTQANEKLKSIAAQDSVTLPADLNAEHQAMKAKLEGLSGKAFDKEYMAGQIKDHEATAELLRTQRDSGQNADAKAFASETLPTVEAHLKHARDLGKKLGVDAGVTK